MRTLPKVLLLFVCFCLCTKVFSQVSIQKSPSWVSSVAFDLSGTPAEGQSSSTYYLLADDQENTLTQEHYLHFAYKILTTEGVQEMSDLSYDFDPAYQKIIFHSLKIFRDGKEINKLTNDFQILQREQSMDRYLYDGSKTAVFNLKDIRKGDIIEYAFTRKGYNPVYNNHIATSIWVDYNVPMDKIFKRIILSSTKKFIEKIVGKPPKYTKSENGNQVEYSWTISKSPGSDSESNTPDWYDESSRLKITDFSSWMQVAEMTAELFQVSEKEKSKLNEAITLLKFPEGNNEDFMLGAIRFVQDEVRYLGFETGLNSHKPHSPVKVLEQRFGDCKDKSLLLATILQSRGIEAWPVLVNTNMRDHLAEELPSMSAFNHCVVKVRTPIRTFYVDPTINNQGGRLEKLFFPDYGMGLVLNPKTVDLETFPPIVTSTLTEVQTFDISSIGGEAMLTVRTSYTGSEADYQRGEFAGKDQETIEKNYLKYYSNLYPDITKWESIKVDDNREGNVFIVEEKYKIPTFWTPANEKEGDDIISCKVYPQTLETYFSVSKSEINRKSPYRLTHPLDFYHTTHLRLPEKWKAEPKEFVAENDYYLIDYSVRHQDNDITRLIHYQTKKDHIPLDMMKTYLSDHEKMNDQLSYVLTYNRKLVNDASKTNYAGILVTVLSLGLGGWLVLYLYRHYNPPGAVEEDDGIPIGGWLVLVGIGVVVSPLRILYDLVTNPDLVSGAGWQIWWATKNIPYFAFSFFTHVYNLVSILFGILVAILFFQRRSSFPRLFSIYIVINAITITADTLVALSVDPTTPMQAKEMIRAIIGAAI
jgi:transglutaminase-like putative cysteine protease